MVDREIATAHVPPPVQPRSDPDVLAAAIAEAGEMLRTAKRPVILAGVELQRFGLTDIVLKMSRRMNIPIAADLLSKATVHEDEPMYLGIYGGAMSSDPAVREYVESADCLLMLGAFTTDMSMGLGTAKLSRSHAILATTESIRVRYHRYDDVQFADFLSELAAIDLPPRKFKHPAPNVEPAPLTEAQRSEGLTMRDVFRIVSLHLDERCCVVADVGDALFGARDCVLPVDPSSSPRPTTARWVSPCRPAWASPSRGRRCVRWYWWAMAHSR